ncbi:Vps5-domain-containing protein [Auricularia subglabra TFB-10046 SS5]|nr:Vps5-domain-containing protein [Auricularia subglabra TFB-10046 SS5]
MAGLDSGGFDDLIRSPDNPFQNAFTSHRPASPDPWAVYPESADYQAQRDAELEYPNAFADEPERDQDALSPATIVPVDAGPLPLPEDDDDEPEPKPAAARRVSQPPAPKSSTPPPPPVEPEPEPESPITRKAAPPTPSPLETTRSSSPRSRNASSHAASPIVSPTTSSIPTPLAPPAPLVNVPLSSPLDPPQPGSARSFERGLSLGGEVPGWAATTQSRFINEPRARSPSPPPAATQELKQDEETELRPDGAESSGPASGGKKEPPKFIISVGDPQKVGDPISAHIIYTVHTKTISKLYRKSEFSVLRRYSDFLWLYETLSLNNPGVIVPPVPEKHPFGRFEDTFVEQRRIGLNKCIQKIANHPLLGEDPDLKLFLESDNFALEVKHRKDERAGLLSTIGSTLTGNKFYETDEWLEGRKSYLDGLEQQLRGLAKAIDIVSKEHAQVAGTILEFADAIAQLGASDLSKHLSHLLGVLADVSRTSAGLHTEQARDDVATLMATVNEYARLTNSVRMAYASRVRSHAAWQRAEATARRVKLNHEEARRQGRIAPDRVAFALAEIAEAEKRANDGKHEFEDVTKLLRAELLRFEQERVEDFKDALEEFLEGMIARQKQLIKTWEEYQELLLQRKGQNPNPSTNARGPVLEAS